MEQIFTIEITKRPTPKSGYGVWKSFERAAPAICIYWRGLNIGRGYRARLKRNGKVIGRKCS